MSDAIYLDTSAFCKHYFQETGSKAVDALFHRDTVKFTSALAYAEFYAVAHRLRRESLLRARELQRVLGLFDADWQKLAVIEFANDVRALVPVVCAKVALRGADLVHLASAILLKQRGAELLFVSSDRRLLNAAEELNMQGLDPAGP